MAKILHFRLNPVDQEEVAVPNGAQILSVVRIEGAMRLCVLAEPSALPDDRCTVYKFCQGEEVEEGPLDPFTRRTEHERKIFLASLVDDVTELVWHVFYTMHRSVSVTMFGQAEPLYKPANPPRGTHT